ncbi:MAG: tripartite tricarboxylate transporter TctB family protein [Pseudomonadota bacterium]|nr:tripartite tricarboxylate transporter TctB family protein [Pseudomonadota bacterium]
MRQRFSADRIGGLLWLLFGAAVVYGSWTMDRLEAQGVNPVTAPGVLPGLVGLGIMAFALVLVLRRGEAPVEGPVGGPADDWRRLGLSWLLCMLFAGVLLGRGLPFWLLAAVFMFLHIVLLDTAERKTEKTLARRAAVALMIAVGVSAAVTYVFQNLFLVRLP